MGGSTDGYSISPAPFTMLLFSRINVPNVARGLDFHVFPLRAQKMVKLCDAWNTVLFVGVEGEFGGSDATANKPQTALELRTDFSSNLDSTSHYVTQSKLLASRTSVP